MSAGDDFGDRLISKGNGGTTGVGISGNRVVLRLGLPPSAGLEEGMTIEATYTPDQADGIATSMREAAELLRRGAIPPAREGQPS